MSPDVRQEAERILRLAGDPLSITAGIFLVPMAAAVAIAQLLLAARLA